MLKNINLENFRSHHKFDLDLDHITIILGPNGAGKTNILEAISLLSFCRSFREDDKKNLINIDKEYARITGDDLELFMTRHPRLILKVKTKGIARKVADFIGYLPSVVFSPETISIITDSPSYRRRFLDIMISQVDREYLVSLMNFKKIRQQRNNLLQHIAKGLGNESELSFWDNEFAKESKIIIDKRGESVRFLNGILAKFYQSISGNKTDVLQLEYHNNFEGDILNHLKESRAREIAYGGTIFGPHRDDLIFKLNGKDMGNFASRGELKSAILALKIAELNFLESKPKFEDNEYAPLLLLDDIFSEFDPVRRAHLSKLISQYQSVITTTEKEHIPEELLKEAKIVELN